MSKYVTQNRPFMEVDEGDIDINTGGYDGVVILEGGELPDLHRPGYVACGIKDHEEGDDRRAYTGIRREVSGDEILSLLKTEKPKKEFLLTFLRNDS